MRSNNAVLVTNAVMNTTITSPAVQLDQIIGYAIQAVYTGTPTGTFKLQASNDPVKLAYDVNPQTPTNWTDIANSSYSVSSAGIYTWNVTDVFYTFVRLVYTDGSSGTSTAVLNANINFKGI